jgi:hypothetical protein
MQQGTEPERTEPYWLAHHVHLALCGHHAVLMDLRRNRYLAVQPAARLSGWIGAWPLPAPMTLGSPPAVLGRLIEHGMLVCERGAGHAATPISIKSPQRTLLEFDFDAPPRPNGRDLRRAAWACAAAASALKLRPMYAVLEQTRRQRPTDAPPGARFDVGHAQALVRRFVHLRPWFYSARGACLLDSLALVTFLAQYGLHPHWVFGVRTAPFHAHCWVQYGSVLFNDVPDRVRQYSPILSI